MIRDVVNIYRNYYGVGLEFSGLFAKNFEHINTTKKIMRKNTNQKLVIIDQLR